MNKLRNYQVFKRNFAGIEFAENLDSIYSSYDDASDGQGMSEGTLRMD
jgi:hypothetical protein